eukprot:SAG11_NODE_4537_length_1860_cov_2.444634_2_plen_142_part_00
MRIGGSGIPLALANTLPSPRGPSGEVWTLTIKPREDSVWRRGQTAAGGDGNLGNMPPISTTPLHTVPPRRTKPRTELRETPSPVDKGGDNADHRTERRLEPRTALGETSSAIHKSDHLSCDPNRPRLGPNWGRPRARPTRV